MHEQHEESNSLTCNLHDPVFVRGDAVPLGPPIGPEELNDGPCFHAAGSPCLKRQVATWAASAALKLGLPHQGQGAGDGEGVVDSAQAEPNKQAQEKRRTSTKQKDWIPATSFAIDGSAPPLHRRHAICRCCLSCRPHPSAPLQRVPSSVLSSERQT